MKQVTLHVAGMSCGSCVNKIEGHVGKRKGVEYVKVKLAEGLVDVKFHEDQISLEEIKGAIQETGYHVVE